MACSISIRSNKAWVVFLRGGSRERLVLILWPGVKAILLQLIQEVCMDWWPARVHVLVERSDAATEKMDSLGSVFFSIDQGNDSICPFYSAIYLTGISAEWQRIWCLRGYWKCIISEERNYSRSLLQLCQADWWHFTAEKQMRGKSHVFLPYATNITTLFHTWIHHFCLH